MKKPVWVMLCCFISSFCFAQASLESLLNKVTLQLQAEQWVSTKTALVNVMINAAVTDQGIEKIQNQVMLKLNQLAVSDWHILSFDRKLDKTGLESIEITAQARLQQIELNNLRDKAKAISKPGETYTIDNVQFIPSEEELRAANIGLRNNIYMQAKNEIDILNKVYPEQKFYLYQIDFISSPVYPVQNEMYAAKTLASAAAPRPVSIAVGNKSQLQATVVLAAVPDAVLRNLPAKA